MDFPPVSARTSRRASVLRMPLEADAVKSQRPDRGNCRRTAASRPAPWPGPTASSPRNIRKVLSGRVHRKAQRPESVRHPGALLAKVLPGPLLPMGQTQRRQPAVWAGVETLQHWPQAAMLPARSPLEHSRYPSRSPAMALQLGKGPEHNQVGIPGQQSLQEGASVKGRKHSSTTRTAPTRPQASSSAATAPGSARDPVGLLGVAEEHQVIAWLDRPGIVRRHPVAPGLFQEKPAGLPPARATATSYSEKVGGRNQRLPGPSRRPWPAAQ